MLTATTPCKGTPLSGKVVDATAAIIPGASLALDELPPILAGSDGRFRIPCATPGKHLLHITAASFAPQDIPLTTPRTGDLNIILQPSAVDTTVQVVADSTADAPSITTSGSSQTLTGQTLNSLADDPDDLLRELQQMAAAAGGSPSGATIGVDGFAGNGEGNTTLPPKSSIAYIKVNPDLFSAENREPPFGGGEIQIFTKPGLPTFHGALFATNSSSWMNARDPFTSGSTNPIGKQRYGAELSGPIRKQGSDFTLTLEHRAIDNVAAVDAIVPDANGNPLAFSQTVPATQALWIGLARTDWQLSPKNTFIASFNANHNTFLNLGVGGNTLAEGGYTEERYEYTTHLSLITTLSPRLLHELRIGIQLDGRTDIPNSTAPQVQVAGDFTGGGSTVQTKHLNEKYNTLDDTLTFTTSHHLMKFGVQNQILDQHKRIPLNFNGTYIFSGSATQTALQQYQAAVKGAAAPTQYSGTAGNPEIDFVQSRIAGFFQDDWKLRENLHFAWGLRYYGQDNPTFVRNYTPRFGLAYTPDKKATWNLNAHAGLFAGLINSGTYAQFLSQDGIERITSLAYNPTTFCSATATSCNPLAGATVLHAINTQQPGLPNTLFGIEGVGFTKNFPRSWTLSASYNIAQIWHETRTENINAPLNNSPTGPRPGTANLNILQWQGTGRGYGNVIFTGLSQQSLKRLQFFLGAVRNQIIDNEDNNPFLTPQTTGVNTGEYARRAGNGLWNVFGNATLTLPYKVKLSGNLSSTGASPYNITTGQDNNGDGDFNDRPRFAPAGTPLCTTNPAAVPCAYATPYGQLTNSGFGPTLSRNKGEMPWTVYLDMNVSRTFALTHNAKAAHPQSLAVNVRSSNILNHENATAVQGVLGSAQFGQTIAADNGRRIEAGLRYTF
jgi:hypothetical protein